MMLRLGEQNASNEAFRAWLGRERIRDPRDVETLVDTYENLRSLRQSGRNHIWGYIARNLSRPLWLSSAHQRVDVIVGNPPWLSYRFMTPLVQKKFREECQKRSLWAGGKLATHQDLSAYFFARCVELYLKHQGTIALIMPCALNRAQFAGFRSGRFNTAEVRFTEAWAFDETVQPLFPVPSSVFFAKRARCGPLPGGITACTDVLPQRDAPLEQAKRALTFRRAEWPKEATLQGGSPYRRAFRQGATMVPRKLCLVDKVATGRLGVNPAALLVESRSGKQDKLPWRDLPALSGTVEAKFLRPLYLGESIAPFRLLRPALAIVPWDETVDQILNAQAAEEKDYPGLARWLKSAERCWREHGRSAMALVDRWNYHDALDRQVPPSPVRVVYAKSRRLLAAAIVTDRSAFIDHKLYRAAVERLEEACYLAAVLNSETTRAQIAALQSRGQWGARDFDKLVFELPIPRFAPSNGLHRDLAQAACRAARLADALDLPEGRHFSRVRRIIRSALRGAGVEQEIDDLVAELLA